MPFPGLKTANERKDVIAYLAAASSPAAAPAVVQRTAAPAAAPANRRPRQPSRRPVHSGCAIPCVQASPKAGWSFIGVGGTIDGQVNPVLSAAEGQWSRSS